MRCIPEAADGMKERGRDGMRWLNGLLKGEWIAGPSFTVADIHLFCFLDDLGEKGQDIPADCEALRSWRERAGNRKAAEMSMWRWRSAAPALERPALNS
jgi:glutathione S-transferase